MQYRCDKKILFIGNLFVGCRSKDSTEDRINNYFDDPNDRIWVNKFCTSIIESYDVNEVRKVLGKTNLSVLINYHDFIQSKLDDALTEKEFIEFMSALNNMHGLANSISYRLIISKSLYINKLENIDEISLAYDALIDEVSKKDSVITRDAISLFTNQLLTFNSDIVEIVSSNMKILLLNNIKKIAKDNLAKVSNRKKEVIRAYNSDVHTDKMKAKKHNQGSSYHREGKCLVRIKK